MGLGMGRGLGKQGMRVRWVGERDGRGCAAEAREREGGLVVGLRGREGGGEVVCHIALIVVNRLFFKKKSVSQYLLVIV